MYTEAGEEEASGYSISGNSVHLQRETKTTMRDWQWLLDVVFHDELSSEDIIRLSSRSNR